MRRIFTLRRWRSKTWQMYPLVLLAWVAMWQVHAGVPVGQVNARTQFALSCTNLVGALVVLVALHLRRERLSNRIEVYGSLPLCWSLFCYLALATQGDWSILFQTTSFGVALIEAVILSSLHRMVWLNLIALIRRYRTRREAKRIVAAVHSEIENGRST